jgi:hypothetical protein
VLATGDASAAVVSAGVAVATCVSTCKACIQGSLSTCRATKLCQF